MLAKLQTLSLLGIDAVRVEVEVPVRALRGGRRVVVGRPHAARQGSLVDGHRGRAQRRAPRDRRARLECGGGRGGGGAGSDSRLLATTTTTPMCVAKKWPNAPW
jgi:hypothetical protein